MQRFIDRQEQLEVLEKEYSRPGSSLVIIYGRRRVGKTTLISRFIKDKQALFFLASEESELQNCSSFKDKVADFIDSDLLRDAQVKTWDPLFQAILDAPFDRKPVIVIDEFQYIGKSNPGFPSVFQRIWEEKLKNRQIMVILCGSLISMMESQTLDYSSPLYGRRTAQIRLSPIPFRYYADFFEGKTRRELIEMYAVTGGIPKYIELFTPCQDIFSAITDNILTPASFLYDEPSFLLQQEVSEVGSYFSIIRSIASGNRKLSAIAGSLGVKATSLSKYLQTLIKLDILEREVPVTENNPEKSKKGLYRIKDNYIRFWFAFIYSNRSFIESGHHAVVMDKLKKSLVSGHIAYVYEDVCRQRMWELNTEQHWPFQFSTVGSWWDAHEQIDIAALDPQGNDLILGECKFWKEPVGLNVWHSLEEKAQRVGWKKRERKLWYVLFSVSGFTTEMKELAASREDICLFD